MIGLRGHVVVVEVRFGNASDARGCGNRARIAEASGGRVFADHACLKLPRRLSDHLVGCKLSLTSAYPACITFSVQTSLCGKHLAF